VPREDCDLVRLFWVISDRVLVLITAMIVILQ